MNNSSNQITGDFLKSEKTGYLEEEPGQKSSTRLKSFLCLLAAFAVAWIELSRSQPSENGLWFFMLLMVGAFAPQAVHKFAETRHGDGPKV